MRDETRYMLVLCRLRMENTNGNYRVYICETCAHGPREERLKRKRIECVMLRA